MCHGHPDPLQLGDTRARRVPGLRREEVAQRAGLSTDYYTRLEQGRHRSPSESVLAGLAEALELDQTAPEQAPSPRKEWREELPIGQSERMSNTELTFRFLAAPTDIGLQGKVPGGRVLEWIDKAAYGMAVAYSKKYAVTAYVGNVHFSEPITIGDLVETEAKVIRTGRTSMTILVRVLAGVPTKEEMTESCRCVLVFVATDENGKPIPVESYVPQTELEKKLHADAEELDKSRTEIETLMSRATYSDAGQGERITMRFLAAPMDVNWGGKVHGGTVMRWIDDAAYACAKRWTGGEAIAIYAGGVRFYRPMLIGQLVEVEARLLYTSDRTMHISVHVRTGDPTTRLMELTCHCLMVLIGLDEEGQPTDVTQWVPTIGEDIALDQHAREMQEARLKHGYLEMFTAH